ncbi:MAG TPA: hypothetical protein VK116_08030, partial [Planctomycetota bacterium]|nr:hypothetical protein [Planctomycetota bacterium]
MSAPGVPDRELIEDFEAVLEGSASPEVRRRLAARLERDPAARAWYLRHVEIHAMLEFEHGLAGRPRVSASSLPAGLPELIMPRRRPVLRHATRLTAAAALLIVVALALRWALFGLGPNGVAVAAPYYDRNASPPPMVAYLETIGEDVATESSVELEANRLRPGTIRVASGVAQHVVFDSKVEIVLHGPAVLGVVSASRAALFQGSLELSSPEGVEFVLDAGAVRLVHHGASSRVEVDDRGAVTVEVIRGEVDARAHTRLPRYLWTFDGPVENVVSGELAIAQTGYKRVEGIIGSGAAFFDDTRAASIDVGNGGGGHVGSGGFS